VRILKGVFFIAGAALLGVVVYRVGAGSIADALQHVAWWQFALVCSFQGFAIAIDAYAWRLTLPDRDAPFTTLVAARCAGDAANLLSGISAVGGDALKAWILRHRIPYRETIPSLIVSKTAELFGQVLLFATAVALAFHAAIGRSLQTAMASLLVVQIVAVGGFFAVQLAGVLGKSERILGWIGVERGDDIRALDLAVRGFYRHQPGRFAAAVACHFAGWCLGIAEAMAILYVLGLSVSATTAVLIETLWSAVRFATFFVPGSLGPIESANAGAFAALGFGAGTGLAFTLIRRARQAVWVAIGALVLVAIAPRRGVGAEPQPAALAGAD